MKRIAVLVLAVSCLVGCEPAGRTSMIPLPPPPGWSEQILDQRAQKDDQFRESPQSPLLAESLAGFRGLEYWPPNPGFYFVGRVHAYPQPEPLTLVTTSGGRRPCEKVGWISFDIDGQVQELQVYRLHDSQPEPGTSGFFLPFVDGGAGRETYPAGRYIELAGPPGGPWVLDFNQAYNPYCAYGEPERFACPVTPVENRLSVRIAAGERGFLEAEGGGG